MQFPLSKLRNRITGDTSMTRVIWVKTVCCLHVSGRRVLGPGWSEHAVWIFFQGNDPKLPTIHQHSLQANVRTTLSVKAYPNFWEAKQSVYRNCLWMLDAQYLEPGSLGTNEILHSREEHTCTKENCAYR